MVMSFDLWFQVDQAKNNGKQLLHKKQTVRLKISYLQVQARVSLQPLDCEKSTDLNENKTRLKCQFTPFIKELRAGGG